MFKLAENVDISQISLTGARGIILAGLLMMEPRTLSEIKQAFLDYNILDKSSSDDILRIDINTLKVMGCEISRASRKTDGKYVLTEHPFTFDIPEHELKILKKVYKALKSNASIELLFEYDDLFKKLASYVINPETKEGLLGISIFKYFDINAVKEMLEDCQNKKVITLIYKKPNAKEATQKDVVAQKLVFNNDQIYLYCYDLNKKDSVMLNFKRIRKIISKRCLNKDDNIEKKQTKIKFHIKSFDKNLLKDTEKITEQNYEGYFIEGIYHNDFVAMQRVLSLGAKCTVLEPLEFRNMIIGKLKEMRKIYE